MKRPGGWAIGLWALAGCSPLAATTAPGDAGGDGPRGLRVPELGPVPPPPLPADGPITPAQVALGTALFFDPRLSGSGHTSCNACHLYLTAFQDNLPRPTPDRSYPADTPLLARNTLSFLNLVQAPVFRWDGSHTDLVAVMAFPFAEPNMNVARRPAGDPVVDLPEAQAALARRLAVDLAGYPPLFRAAFGADITTLEPAAVFRLAGRALAAFATQASSRDAAFDRWNAGDDSALDAAALRGLALFRGRGRCIACHVGPLLSDFAFHNLSSSPPRADGTRADEGRFRVTGVAADRGRFLTPTLRGAYDTAPYFHDGSMGSLAAVLRFLSSPAVQADPGHDPIFDTPLDLSDADAADLLSFLRSLRGAPVTGIVPPRLP